MTEERRIQLVAEVDTTQTGQGFQQIGQQAEGMANRVSAAGERAEQAVEQIGQGAERSAQQVEAAQRNLINSIQRTSAAMESGSRTSAQYFETLASQRGVDPAALRPYLDQLRAIEAAQANANATTRAGAQSLQLVGQSAAQTAAALRQVPAQITDIVVGLQGGQRPLTVLFQQGGQLRDMFGGIGNAARALGTTLSGMISPMALLAAAAAALAVAYYQGSQEADAYNKALISTGNAAATTTNQLSDMARAIRGSTEFTQGAAAEALAALAATGKVPAENLQQFATVALKVQRDLGVGIKDTAKDFAELGKAPLQTTEKLNEQLNYLTSDVYRQIKALQDLGKTSEAAALAQKTYADALTERSGAMEAKLGILEKAWRSVADGAKAAWDNILDVGRESTLEQKLAKVQGSIRTAELLRGSFIYSADSDARIKGLREEEAKLQNKIQLEKTVSSIKAEQNRFNEADIAWQKEGEQFLSKKQQMEREVAASRERGLASGQSDAAIAEREASIRKKYAGEYNDIINAQIEAIKRRGEIEETVAQRSANALTAAREVQKAGEAVQQNRLVALDNELQYMKDAAALEDASDARAKARLQQELKLTAGKENSLKEQADLRGQIAALDEKGLTRRIKLQTDLDALQDKAALQSMGEANSRLDAIEATNAGLEKQIQTQQQANAVIGLSKAQVDALNASLLDESAIRKETEADILDTIVGREAEADSLRKTAKLYRDLADAQRGGILKQADFDQQKAFWTSLEDTAHRTFTSIFDGGKNAAQRLKDTFKNVFFDWLYQMTAKKWLVNVAASLGVNTGAVFGSANAAEAAGNLASSAGGGGAGSFLQAGSALFSSIKSGFDGLSESIADAVQGIQYGTGLSPNILTNNQVSQFAGQLGSTLAGYGIGSVLNKTISGQFQTGSTVMAVERVATAAASAFFGPVGGAVAGAVSGAINRLFGRGPKEITATGIRGSFSGDTFTGQAFADFFQKGGLLRSDKRGTDLSPLAAEQQKVFDDTFKGIKDATAAYASALGVSTDVITGYSKQINLTLSKDQAENEKLIADLFAGIGDEIAGSLAVDLAPFQQAGEHLSATLQRVATDFTAVGAVFKGLGVDIDAALGAVGVASLAAREHLVAFAGGLQNLVNQAAFFQQNFLSDAEKIAPVQQQVSAALKELGYSGLTTVAQFHDAVLALTNSGALASEAGQKAFTGLLAIAPQFKQVADYLAQIEASKAAEALQATADALKATEDAASNAQKAISASMDAAKQGASAAFGALQRSVDKAKKDLAAAYQQQSDVLKTAIAASQVSIERLKSISATLRGALGTIAVPLTREQAQAQLAQAAAAVKAGGKVPDLASLKDALGVVQQDASSQFATALDFQRDQAKTRDSLTTLADAADSELTIAQQQMDLQQAQLDTLTKTYEAEVAYYDQVLENAQAQLDAVNGVDNSVKSVEDALRDLAAAIATLRQANSASGQIAQAYQSILGRPADAGGLAFYTSAANQGTSIADIVKDIAASPEAQLQRLYQTTLGRTADQGGLAFYMQALAGGTSLEAVRQDLLNSLEKQAQAAPPPTVAPQRVADAMLVASSNDQITQQLESLQQVTVSGFMTLAGHAKSTSDTLDQFNLQGMPETRT